MTGPARNWDKAKWGAWLVGAAGTFLIVAALTWFIIQRTRPAGVDVARAQLRTKNLADLRADNDSAQKTYGWIEPNKGIVRLPVDRAVELSLALWQDPPAARSNLLERLAKATAKAPEPVNQYE